MTQAIPAIPAVDATALAAPVQAAPAATPPSLVQRFEQLLAQAPATGLQPAAAPTHLGQAVQALHAGQRQLEVDMQRALVEGPQMDLQALTAMQTSLTLQTAVASAQLTVSTSLVQSGKNSLNTLMKNQ
jgi:hypothetical protein